MLKRVEPLRNELQKLEDDAKDNQQKANEVEQMIRDLEASIARYKEEYAVLISEAQAIKADLAAVEAKVSPRGPAPSAHTRILPLGVNMRGLLASLGRGSQHHEHVLHAPPLSQPVSSVVAERMLGALSGM